MLWVFSCAFCKNSKNPFFKNTPPVAASERWKIVKPIILQRNFFTQVTGNRVNDHYARNVYMKVFLYNCICINNCSVDVIAIKNTSSIQQIRSKIPTVSVVQVFSTELYLQFLFAGFFLNTRSTREFFFFF